MKTWMLLALCALGCNSGSLPGNDTSSTMDTAFPDTAVPPGCSSNHTWNYGNAESPLMHPGTDCIDCHTSHREGPTFSAAGTVMGSWHDVDDCFGVQGVTVRITDANGQVHTMSTNNAGNFMTRDNIPTPFTAEIEYQGNVRVMFSEQTDLDCVVCHTQQGNNMAPGRITVP